MENEEMITKNNHMKVDIPTSESDQMSPPSSGAPGGLTRQGSLVKSNCLCSPTTHAGSFRCRLHRTPGPVLQRNKSIDSASIKDSQSKANTETTNVGITQ